MFDTNNRWSVFLKSVCIKNSFPIDGRVIFEKLNYFSKRAIFVTGAFNFAPNAIYSLNKG